MRSNKLLAAILVSTFVVVFCLTTLSQPSLAKSDNLKQNKKVVERYITEIIDKMGVGDAPQDKWNAMADEVGKAIDELFSEKAIQHYPGMPPSAPKGLLQMIRMGVNKSMVTTVHNIIAEGNLVVAYVSHDLTPMAGSSVMQPRIGCMVKASGETIHWDAMALFKLEDGKIVEQWVSRDDLGALLQYGKITFEPCSPMPKK